MIKILFPLIFSKTFFRKIFIIALLIGFFFIFKGFLSLFLITFIFSYLSLEVAEFLQNLLKQWLANNPNSVFWKKIVKYLHINILVTILYIFFVVMIVWLVVSIIPKIGEEIEKLIRQMPWIAAQIQGLLANLEESVGLKLWSGDIVENTIKKFNYNQTGGEILRHIQNTSGILLQFFLGLIMSYIFITDRKDIFAFFSKMKHGNFAFIYEEFHYIWQKILSGFGRVFKAQGIIAFVNAVLTTLWLLIIGYFLWNGSFPYIVTLSIIVFIFGFIPVFGTFLSGLPIIIIGYGVGWIPMIIAITVMISVIHAIEAYILNPRIVSSYMHFPVFITFSTLIIAEHIFGMIGLIIWVPILAIVISIFSDLNRYISHIKNEYTLRKRHRQLSFEDIYKERK